MKEAPSKKSRWFFWFGWATEKLEAWLEKEAPRLAPGVGRPRAESLSFPKGTRQTGAHLHRLSAGATGRRILDPLPGRRLGTRRGRIRVLHLAHGVRRRRPARYFSPTSIRSFRGINASWPSWSLSCCVSFRRGRAAFSSAGGNRLTSRCCSVRTRSHASSWPDTWSRSIGRTPDSEPAGRDARGIPQREMPTRPHLPPLPWPSTPSTSACDAAPPRSGAVLPP